MATHEIESKKRKRKHKSKKEDAASVPAPAPEPSNGVLDKPRKKAKKEHTPEPEVEDEFEGFGDEEQGEEALNQELKDIVENTGAAKIGSEDEDVDEADDANEADANSTEQPDDLPSGTSVSLPIVKDPETFSDLNLSERTMEGIRGMNFTTLTEIQKYVCVVPVIGISNGWTEKQYRR